MAKDSLGKKLRNGLFVLVRIHDSLGFGKVFDFDVETGEAYVQSALPSDEKAAKAGNLIEQYVTSSDKIVIVPPSFVPDKIKTILNKIYKQYKKVEKKSHKKRRNGN